MSLDVSLYEPHVCDRCGYVEASENEIYTANITHNLVPMALEAGVYQCLWRPEDYGYIRARSLIAPLKKGLADLRARPGHFKKFDAPNGWGLYVHFVPFVEKYLRACKENPKAFVKVSR